MTHRAYIQSFKNIPVDDWGFQAYLGFNKRGTDIIFFEDIMQVPANRLNIVVAHINETREYFGRIGIDVPSPMNIPGVLLPYAKRKVEVKTMKQFRDNPTYPIFIKPQDTLKGFLAGVLKNESSLRTFDAFERDVNDDTMVMTSEVIDIVSEYRGFVVD
jgi:hypothetical protein